ncbi:hypothetical protein [Haloactinomyces albus]|uniref:hypothetical protein n=1 Tax=Haloactinomyces albus TaxID=1352928 RepID=UPI00286D5103|nr:hypothetical protein [Haloactinomyces albus]
MVLVVSLFVLGGDEIEAGDCIGSDEVAMNADIFVAECGSVRSSYRVVQVVEGPIGSPEGIFQRCGGSFWEKEPDRVLCITPDFAASDCLTTGGNPDAAPIKVACGDPRADLRVTEVKHVVPGEDVCGVLESYLGTRTPPLTACFTRVSAS